MSAGGHTAPVAAVAARGDVIVSGAYDGEVIVHRLDPGGLTTLQRIEGVHGRGINAVALSPDGARIATGGSDGRAILLDREGQRIATVDQPVDVEAVAFSRDGALLCSGGTDGRAKILALVDGRVVTVEHGKTVGALITDATGFVSGCNDRAVRRIARDGAVLAEMTAADGPIKSLAWARGHLLVGAHDSTIRRVDLDRRTAIVVAELPTTPKAMATTPDSARLVVACYDQRLRVYAVSDDGRLALESELRLPRAWGHALAVGDGFAVVGSFDGLPVIVELGEDRLREVPAPRTEVGCISAMIVGPEGGVLAGGDSGRIRSIDAAGGSDTRATLAGAITTIARAPGGAAVIGTWDGEIAVLERDSRMRTLVRDLPAPVLSIDVPEDYPFVLAGLYTGGAMAFDLATGEVRWVCRESTGATKRVAARGGFGLLVGRYDPARLVSLADGRVHDRLPLQTPVSDVCAFRPASMGPGLTAAVAARAGEIWFVRIDAHDADGAMRVIGESAGHGLAPKAIAWIDPESVAAAGYDGAVIVHRIGQSPRIVGRASGRLGVSSLAIHAGHILAATFDGEVQRFPIPHFEENPQ